jgi:UDP-MurNAc hydroxylase
MSATVQFLNHASVVLEAGEASVVSDPWYSGAAFNQGWDLLAPDPSLGEVAERARNIWISHEHPDHFSVDFFRNREPGAEVLFQKTRDRRVASFLEKVGWRVRECAEGVPVDIGGATLTVGRKDFYDSWGLFEGGGARILNLNDCAFRTPDALERLRATTGPIDVLLTQFSYAGWKGGRDQRPLREEAARERLRILSLQAEVLKPRWVVPFASFIYFSHEDNAYLNDAANAVDAVEAVLPAGCDAIVMKPRDRWTVGEAWDSAPAIAFWRERVAHARTAPRHAAGAAVGIDVLSVEADEWRARFARRNGKLWMRFASFVPLAGALRPVRVWLTDLRRLVEVSPFSPLRALDGRAPFDTAMASECLSFVFRNEFGFDTLVVNGRFEASPAGFRRMQRTFALGSLNAMGLRLGPSLLLRSDVLLLLLRGLRGRPPEAKSW